MGERIINSFSKKSYFYWFNPQSKYYGIYEYEKFFNYFLSFFKNKSILNNEKIKIYDIFDDNEIFEKDKINIMISIENCKKWGKIRKYKHYNLFGDFGNENIDIYIYNHYSKFIENKKYIMIPLIYLQTDYLINNYNKIKPSNIIKFKNKKFCLVVSFHKRGFPSQKKKIKKTLNKLNDIGKIDSIKDYYNIIGDVSCYHSEELLNLFNNYKFILCFENSFDDGYITEKIFNVYFSRSIPIYCGPYDSIKYFNKDSFFNINHVDDSMFENIEKLNYSEEKYNSFINQKKINNYENENYINKVKKFLKNKINITY